MGKNFQISGQLKSTDKVNWRKIKVEIHALVNGKVITSSPIDGKGKYKLKFKGDHVPINTELRVTPVTKKKLSVETKMLSQSVASMQFTKKRDTYIAAKDILIPGRYLEILWCRTKKYRLAGVTYAQYPLHFEILPGMKLEFYEVDRPLVWLWGTTPSTTESLLGTAYSQTDGSYEFEFSFSYHFLSLWFLQDRVPDIRVKIYQLEDGNWHKIFTSNVDWNIDELFLRDYLVPWEDIRPAPPGGVEPSEGFRFISLGLIPIDESAINPRFSKGYVTCYSGDPAGVSGVRHQPLCGQLRIFGLFASAPPVATYEIQLATADENGLTGGWTNITDALHNRQWDSIQRRYNHKLLGPDPVTLRYKNIDTDPEADWHEHSLKLTWNSNNVPDDYYVIRIIGYDSADNMVVTQQMPVVRIANSVPETKLSTTNSIGVCGHTTLSSSRNIEFKVTAHDPDGHVLRYSLKGSRGNPAVDENAGDTQKEARPTTDLLWNGVQNKSVLFPVKLRTPEYAACNPLAYNFELHVYGLATNGYSAEPRSQHVKKEVNLVVSE